MRLPVVGACTSLEEAYARAFYTYNKMTLAIGGEHRRTKRLFERNLYPLHQMFLTEYLLTPHKLDTPVNEMTFALSGLHVVADYVVRFYEHPSDEALDTYDVDLEVQELKLVYGYMTGRVFPLEPVDDSDQNGVVQDIYAVGLDFDSIIDTSREPRLTYVPLEGLEVLNRTFKFE